MPKTKEQCEKIRDTMREKILSESLSYFAEKGLSAVKVSDLAKHIGIGQGTLYSYFSSIEDLFKAIVQKVSQDNENSLDALYTAPITSKEKVLALSESILKQIYTNKEVAQTFALNVHMIIVFGNNNTFSQNYSKSPNAVLSRIIEEGQKEGGFIDGNPRLLADFFWSVVHMIALQSLFENSDNLKPEHSQLSRILIKD